MYCCDRKQDYNQVRVPGNVFHTGYPGSPFSPGAPAAPLKPWKKYEYCSVAVINPPTPMRI